MSFQDKIRNPNCKLCPLHEDAEYVCLMGSGKKSAKIMVVGEAPGEREDEEHAAFVGPAGQLLTELLEGVGIKRADCYITNVAKCRPDGNATPTRGQVKVCVDAYLAEEIRRVNPTFILVLGNSALQGVARKSGITKHRGSAFSSAIAPHAVVFATFHPAYALRAPQHLPALRADMARFARLIHGESSSTGPTRVKIIRSAQHLKWAYQYLMASDVISWDLETTSLDEWRPDSKVVSLGFTNKAGEGIVVPLHHARSPWKHPDRVLGFLKPCFERTDAKYVAHNGKFDARWMAANGVFVRQDFDTMLAAHVLDENRPKGLKPLSQILLGADAYDIGSDVRDAYNVELRRLCVYNAKDVDYTIRLYYLFREQLKQEPRTARVFVKLMMPASNALTRVERIGPYIDPERLNERYAKTVSKHQRVVKKLHRKAKAPQGINFNSPQQVGRWLFGDLGLPILLETKTGAPSTSESVILQLAKRSPEVKYLLEYRKLTKYVNTYFANWMDLDDKSRFHPGYKLFGTVTGRLSGDFQQVPRDPYMRSIVGAPAGWAFVESDFSQVELRIAAMVANERRMLRAFALGHDLHLQTACAITGKRPQDITPEERKLAKAVNFGFLYSMGWLKFIEYARDNYDVEVDEADARAFRDRFFESYPALLTWHDRQRRLVHRYQRVSSPIGRVRHLPDVLSSDQRVVGEAERQAINSPVQSCASDLMLLSLVRLVGSLRPNEARVVGTVHDSGLFEVRWDALDKVLPHIHRTMTDMDYVYKKFGTRITVPITVDIKYGQHWGEGKLWQG